jgi:RNA polymerase sigma-70 factor, ECF subfamily
MRFLQNLGKKTDEELLQLIRDGNKEAFSVLYSRYSIKLYNFFLRMLDKDHGKAEDFTHDLFLKIIENPFLFDMNRRFDTWVFHIAYNICKNEYRKMAVRNEYQQGPGKDLPVITEAGNDRSDVLKFSEALDHHLQLLDERHKMVFLLRYQQEISIREIAEILDCPEGTVKSRLFTAIKRLSKKLSVFDPKIN